MGRGQPRGGGRGRSRGAAKGRGGGRGANRGRGGLRAARVRGEVDGKLDSWKTAKDVPMDEEDEFFAARDKILLDDTARARARAGPGMGDEDEFDQDDEVFGLDGVGGSSEDEDDEDEDIGDDPPARTKPKAKTKHVAQTEDSEASSDSEAELSYWGKSRSAYYANDSRIMDEDDAEAREMEEREGRRLQAKMVAEIREDDWGYNDVHDAAKDAADSLSAVPATLPLPTDKASLLRHMEKHDPLALALARDWEDTAYQVMETSAAVKEIGATNPNDPALGLMHLHHQTLLSYATTLAFYLHLQSTPSGISTSDVVPAPAPLAPTEAKRLRTEVVSRLLTLKQALATLEDLGFAVDEDGDGDGDEDDEDEDEDDLSDEDDMSVDGDTSFQINSGEDSEGSDDVSPYGLRPGEQVSHANGGTPRLQNLEEEWQREKIAGWVDSPASLKGNGGKKKKQSSSGLGALEEGELEALMQDALELEEPSTSSPPKKRSRKAGTMESDDKEAKKKKKKHTAPTAPVFDLVEPEFASTKSKDKGKQPLVANAGVDSEAFGDPMQLSHTDASDKAGRRRTLRFHTSKIESASNRRSAARVGMGGDDDLPYRERRKEQKRKGLGEGGDDLEMDTEMNGDTGVDIDTPSIGKRARESASPVGDDETEGEDGYYDLVRKAKKQRKEEKKTEYESMRAAERIDPDEESASGPRSLTRAILKNRGMTPNRSPKNKAARNPRVKKKIQYTKAQKKLGSRQAVFKGDAEVAAAREARDYPTSAVVGSGEKLSQSPIMYRTSAFKISRAAARIEKRGLADLTVLPARKPVISYGPPGRSAVTGHVATVFGCTGFLGRYLVSKLAKAGTQVVIPYRDEDEKRHLRVLGDLGQIVPLEWDLRHEDQIAECMKHSDIVYNLVGRDYETKNFDYASVHITGAQTIANIASQLQIPRLVHISHLNASHKSESEFYRTKAEGEDAVRTAYPDATIVRPGPMFGHEDKLLTSMAVWPALWTLNHGETKIRPAHVLDVAQALANLLTTPAPGRTFNLPGPAYHTYETMLDLIAAVTCSPPTRALTVPKPIAMALARAAQVVWWPALSPDEVIRRYINDSGVPGDWEALGVVPEEVEGHAITYLRRYRSAANFARPVQLPAARPAVAAR